MLITFPVSIPNTIFQEFFFSINLIEWNNTDINIRNSESYATFKKSILRFIRPSENPIFNCHNLSGINLITRLRLDFSHFGELKFRHNSQDTLNSICSCGENIETTTHYNCSNYLNESMTLDKKHNKRHKYFKFYHSIYI